MLGLERGSLTALAVLLLQGCGGSDSQNNAVWDPTTAALDTERVAIAVDEGWPAIDYTPRRPVDGQARFSLAGDDATEFVIDPVTGLITAPNGFDHELPRDKDGDNVYHLELLEYVSSHAQTYTLAQLTITVRDLTAGVQADLGVDSLARNLQINWSVADIDPQVLGFRVLENADGASGFSAIDRNRDGVVGAGDDLAPEERHAYLPAALAARPLQSRQFLIESLDAEASVLATSAAVSTASLDGMGLISYLKSSQPDNSDFFGQSVALSADGSVLAVGATGEDGSGSGIDPAHDNVLNNAGAVYVYRKVAGRWSDPVYIKSNNPSAADAFGQSVALSADGTVLAVSAPNEDGAGVGLNPSVDDASSDTGAVYVFRRENGSWQQTDYVKSLNTGAGDKFADEIALSGDGNTLAVGAELEDGAGVGVNAAVDDLSSSAGAVYVYHFDGAVWQGSDYLKSSNTDPFDRFGSAVSLSSDGTVLAVGAMREDGSGAGVSPAVDDAASRAGAVYVYRQVAGVWQGPVYIKASNSGLGDHFGVDVTLSADGAVLAVSAHHEDGAGAGVDPADNDSSGSAGAVYVYRYDGASWAAPHYLKASNPGADDQFGNRVLLNDAGDLLAVGARYEDGGESGVAATDDNTALNAGAVYVYRHRGGVWAEPRYLKSSHSFVGDQFGVVMAMDRDGETLAVGANWENGNGGGINPPADKSGVKTGAVYLY